MLIHVPFRELIDFWSCLLEWKSWLDSLTERAVSSLVLFSPWVKLLRNNSRWPEVALFGVYSSSFSLLAYLANILALAILATRFGMF